MSVFGVPRHHVTRVNGFPRKVPENVIQVVVRAVQYAWAQILADPAGELETPAPGNPLEDIFSEAICNILEGLLHASPSPVPGFDSKVFVTVSRGDHLGNFSGTSINKRPDFAIRLAAPLPTSAARLVGIFIESKIVQPASPMRLYTDDGLLRFVHGDYAWAMQAGLMLAYQRASGRPLTDLTKRLHTTTHLGTRREVAVMAIADASGAKKSHLPLPLLTYRTVPAMVRSQHERAWTYTADNESPGDIDVWHVWDLPLPAGY
jgi:hypothetical protein